MNRPLTLRPWRLLLLSLLALVAVVAAVDLRPAREATPPRAALLAHGAGGLLAGAGRAEVDLLPEPVLAGYRPFGRRPTEAGTRLFVRSLLLEAGGARTAIVLLELMTAPASLVEAVEARAAAAGADCALVVATHTHSGPGGYDRDFIPQAVIGRFDPEVEAAILAAVDASLAAARADLGPAAHLVAEGREPALVRNRDHRGEPVDDRLTLHAFHRPDGSRVAALIRFAAHPTLAPRAVGPTGDWPGLAMQGLEAEGGVVLVVPGAVGDARPAPVEGPAAARPALYAEQVAAAVAALEPQAEPAAVELACTAARFDLPPADLGAMVPRGLGTLVSNLVAPLAPQEGRVLALQLGGHVLVGVPAEPIRDVALGLEAIAGGEARVIGTAQGYLGYLPRAREAEKRAPSARYAWFGTALAPRVEEAVRAATTALARERSGASPPMPQGGSAISAP